MHIMLPKRVYTWQPEQECAFEKLRELLCSSPVLKLTDLQRHVIVDTEACVDAMGTVLLQ